MSINHPAIRTQDRTGFACPEVHEGTLVGGGYFTFYFRHGNASLTVKIGGDYVSYQSMAVEQPGTADGIFDSDGIRDEVFAALLPQAFAGLEALL